MSRDNIWKRLLQGVRRLRQRSDWAHFAGPDWPDRIMAAEMTDDFHAKQGRSTGRWVLQTDGRSLAVYLKRHYRLAWWRGLLATLWPEAGWSPALQETRHLDWALSQGLAVPPVVAAGEYIGPWGRLQSFLAVEELTGMLGLHQAVPLAEANLVSGDFQIWKRTLASELARLVRELHQRRWFHKDLYLCHFFIPREDCKRLPEWRGRVHLIDLHRLARHPWTWFRWQVKDLAQLLYSSEIAGINARDRCWFWRAYVGDIRENRCQTWLRWWIVTKWRMYRNHNLKRKAEGRGRKSEV